MNLNQKITIELTNNKMKKKQQKIIKKKDVRSLGN